MTREMARLLISPTNAWPRLRQDYDHHPFAFLVPLLLLPLLPAACLFIGTTQVGWSLPGNDSVQHLSSGSALLLATMCYLGFVAGVVIMGFFVRWVLFRTPSRPSVPGSLTFTTAIAVPLMLAGIVALTLHCPLTEDTRGMLGAAELALMKPGAFLVNTARGDLVDEQALADALRGGHLGGAATDVLSVEPPRNGNPLLAPDIPRLIVTPHNAWGSREARQRIVGQLAENAEAWKAGRALRVVNAG